MSKGEQVTDAAKRYISLTSFSDSITEQEEKRRKFGELRLMLKPTIAFSRHA
jgi:hypothetical protein